MIARVGLSDARKNGLDVYWMTQDVARVNTTVRHLTTTLARTESFFGGKWFRITFWEPKEFGKRKKHALRKWYRLDLAIADRYDTFAKIATDEYSLIGDVSADKVRELDERSR
jgi:hypothetical protein